MSDNLRIVGPTDGYTAVNVLPETGDAFDINIGQYGAGGDPDGLRRGLHVEITSKIPTVITVDGQRWAPERNFGPNLLDVPAAEWHATWQVAGCQAVVAFGPASVLVTLADGELFVAFGSDGTAIYIETEPRP